MDDPKKPSRSGTPQPAEVPNDVPEAIDRQPVLPEGPFPGLPVATDPLLQPMPRPDRRDVPPLD